MHRTKADTRTFLLSHFSNHYVLPLQLLHNITGPNQLSLQEEASITNMLTAYNDDGKLLRHRALGRESARYSPC